MDKQLLEQEAEKFSKTYRSREQISASKHGYIAGATSSSTLLNFCHWIGKKGYKINGYDDGQLMTIINQFKTENNL